MITKTAKVAWFGQEITGKAREGAARGLGLAAENVLEKSNRIVPILVGTPGLMSSGVADLDSQTLTASVSYDTPYACYQHETLHLRHKPGRKAKYLELTINDPGVKSQTNRIVSDEVRKAIG